MDSVEICIIHQGRGTRSIINTATVLHVFLIVIVFVVVFVIVVVVVGSMFTPVYATGEEPETGN